MLHDCRGTIHTLVYVNCASVGLVWFSACAPIRDGLGRMYTIFIAEINGIQGRLLAERSYGHCFCINKVWVCIVCIRQTL